MFYYLDGIISEIEPYLAVLDCGGVGFAVNTTLNTLSHLKKGEKAKLYVYMHVKEDAMDLYGFLTEREKRTYKMLIGVSGVGPKAAISILSASTPENLAMAVISGDEKALTIAPGIGKKIAQRVILELKDKIAKESPDMSFMGAPRSGAVPLEAKQLADAGAALAVLGYGAAEINAALKNVDVASMTAEEIIKAALKNMMK